MYYLVGKVQYDNRGPYIEFENIIVFNDKLADHRIVKYLDCNYNEIESLRRYIEFREPDLLEEIRRFYVYEYLGNYIIRVPHDVNNMCYVVISLQPSDVLPTANKSPKVIQIKSDYVIFDKLHRVSRSNSNFLYPIALKIYSLFHPEEKIDLFTPSFSLSSPTDIIGNKIYGYVIKELVGEGGTSYVFKAERDGVLYAMKVYKPIVRQQQGKTTITNTQNFFNSIYQEANNLISLSESSQHIIKLIAVHLDRNEINNLMKGKLDWDNPPAIIMEYAKGGNIKELLVHNPDIVKHKRWDKIVAHVIFNVALGLKDIHKAGFVHLDIKPQNIYFTEPIYSDDPLDLLASSYIKIGDLGSATRIGKPVTQLTLEYCPPEQIAYPAHPSMDVYALGTTAYTLLTGSVYNDVNVMNALYYSKGNYSLFAQYWNYAYQVLYNKWYSLPNVGIMGVIKEMVHPNYMFRPDIDTVINKLKQFL